MINGSWDATVKVWSVTVATGETFSINREPLVELFDAETSLVCLTAIPVPNGGSACSCWLCRRRIHSLELPQQRSECRIHKEHSRRGSGPCSAIKWISEGSQVHLVAGFSTGKVASFSVAEGMLRKASAVLLGVAVQCLDHSDGILLVGCADGGLRLLPIRDGAYFDAKPTLWPALNDNSAPGMSCVSIAATIGNGKQGSAGRLYCCTGADDGTVACLN